MNAQSPGEPLAALIPLALAWKNAFLPHFSKDGKASQPRTPGCGSPFKKESSADPNGQVGRTSAAPASVARGTSKKGAALKSSPPVTIIPSGTVPLFPQGKRNAPAKSYGPYRTPKCRFMGASEVWVTEPDLAGFPTAQVLFAAVVDRPIQGRNLISLRTKPPASPEVSPTV